MFPFVPPQPVNGNFQALTPLPAPRCRPPPLPAVDPVARLFRAQLLGTEAQHVEHVARLAP